MTDRRVQRTRELLQNALIDLISERGYDGLTIQDIVDRANVGRTTFYLHFNSKEDLFVSCHEAIVSQFQFGPLWPLSREEFFAPEPPSGMVSASRSPRARVRLMATRARACGRTGWKSAQPHATSTPGQRPG